MLCDLKSGRSNDRKRTCAKITEQVEIQERTGWTDWIFSGFTITYIWLKNLFGIGWLLHEAAWLVAVLGILSIFYRLLLLQYIMLKAFS